MGGNACQLGRVEGQHGEQTPGFRLSQRPNAGTRGNNSSFIAYGAFIHYLIWFSKEYKENGNSLPDWVSSAPLASDILDTLFWHHWWGYLMLLHVFLSCIRLQVSQDQWRLAQGLAQSRRLLNVWRNNFQGWNKLSLSCEIQLIITTRSLTCKHYLRLSISIFLLKSKCLEIKPTRKLNEKKFIIQKQCKQTCLKFG